MRDLAQHPDPGSGGDAWALATIAATVLAVDPRGLGGAVLRAWPGPARDAWIASFRALLPMDAPWRRLPPGAEDDALLGGLDLAATLGAGRPVMRRGLLAAADGGVVVVPGAERAGARLSAHLAAALDRGEVDGAGGPAAARLSLLLLDEGAEPAEAAPGALADRLAFRLSLDAVPLCEITEPVATPEQVAAARRRLAAVSTPDDAVAALVATAAAFAITSPRAPLMALRCARALAALDGRDAPEETDLAIAAQLVLAPRAMALPAVPEEEPEEGPPDDPEPDDDRPDDAGAEPPEDGASGDDDAGGTVPGEILLEAVLSALPPGVLEALAAGSAPRGSGEGGASGALRAGALRGRPAGARRGTPGGGARLAIIDTLRTAAPWQPVRRREARPGGDRRLVEIRRDDLRVRRLTDRRATLTIFAVDASGSAALARLAEAKGAVELLLAEAYRRRDQVALVSFRQTAAEVLLPPTRALARAKRALGALPGGGGTPLAAGLDAARVLAEAALRRGQTPSVVLLTDGRANVARDGQGGRARAREDALAAATALRAGGVAGIVIDTSPRPGPEARAIADAMGARHIALPRADARALGAAVIAARTGA